MVNNLKILCSKNVSEEFSEICEEQHILLDVHPFIKTVPIIDKDLQTQIKDLSHRSINVIFTSTTSVNIVANILESISPKWTIFCVGQNTATLALRSFPNSTISFVANYGKELGEYLISQYEINDFIFFCGKSRRNELPAMMKLANKNLEEILLYHTEPTAIRINKNYDGIVFCSPSAVDSFFSINKVSEPTVLFSIGNTTSEQISKYSTNKIITTSIPLMENILNDILKYFQQIKLEQKI